MRTSTLAATTTAVIATAIAGGMSSRPAQSRWYAKLRKPTYQPPRQVFPIVWPFLYADIAVVSALAMDGLIDNDESRRARGYRLALGANLLLNASWSWLFFTWRKLGASALAAAALTVSSADLSRRAAAVRVEAGAALLPYPLWCAFAAALSTHVWLLNRRS